MGASYFILGSREVVPKAIIYLIKYQIQNLPTFTSSKNYHVPHKKVFRMECKNHVGAKNSYLLSVQDS